MAHRPIVPWFAPKFDSDETSKIAAVIDSGFVNDGPITTEFENVVAQYVGRKYGVAVTSGTAALALALMSLGIGPGDSVIVPDLTFIATANAVQLTGALVVLCDVNPETMCVDVDSVHLAMTSRTRALIAVEINGRSPDYVALQEFCKLRNIALITDSCESLGSNGLGKFGVMSCLSFSPNKIITTGQGGMVLTDSATIHSRLRALKDQGRFYRGTGGGEDEHTTLGFNFKFTDIQAAIGLAQMSKIEHRIKTIHLRDWLYRKHLPLISLETNPGQVSLWFDVLSAKRDIVARMLRSISFGVREFWKPLHTQAPYRDLMCKFPVATNFSRYGLWLPSNFDLTESDIIAISRCIEGAINVPLAG